MLDGLIWTFVAAAAILCCSATLKRSADAFLSSSLVISFFATSRAVLPFYSIYVLVIVNREIMEVIKGNIYSIKKEEIYGNGK